MELETKCVQSGYTPKSGEPRVLPVAMSTTFKYDSTNDVGDLFDLKKNGFFYTRLSNPTVAAVEDKINAMDGGVGAMMTSSGQAASLIAVTNLANAGDHIVAANEIYGGTTNLFAVTLKKFGIETTFVNINNLSEVEAAIRSNTKAVFAETIANPAVTVTDIEGVAKVAHAHKIPLIIDNTFATPVICRPFLFGADIVVYSTSKYLDGHAVALGGMIVDGGKFDYAASGKFPGLTEPDESYHGLSYTQTFGNAAFITKARVQLMRDLGMSPSPMNAFLLNLGTETLHLRMKAHCENAVAVAKLLKAHNAVKSVKYPALQSDGSYALCNKYCGGMGSGVITFDVGTRENAVRFMDSLSLAAIVVHVADARTSVLHPASSTHRQLTDAQLAAAGITPGTIRLSVGIEAASDIMRDIQSGLDVL
ncbi:MAG: O-acetylhomoserine aminocarboxypropyltransferase/cysteine synthase [Clostridia bacterium]|nr:O-acetylhomoserine aminocarboxypropyltransferase/cysteine synthase [Clostridia bacterium]